MLDEDVKMIIDMKEDIAGIKALLTTMVNTNSIALEASQSARSAHYRLVEVNKRVDETNKHYDDEVKAINKRLDEEMKERRVGQRWLIGTTLSVVALFMTAIGLLWKAVS